MGSDFEGYLDMCKVTSDIRLDHVIFTVHMPCGPMTPWRRFEIIDHRAGTWARSSLERVLDPKLFAVLAQVLVNYRNDPAWAGGAFGADMSGIENNRDQWESRQFGRSEGWDGEWRGSYEEDQFVWHSQEHKEQKQ